MRFLRLLTAAAAAVAIVGAISCIGNGSPNPSGLQVDVEPLSSATLVLTNCNGASPTQTCAFSGSMINNGPGCATNIMGTTTTSTTSSSAQIGTANWTYSGTMLAGQTATYSGTGLGAANPASATVYHTTINSVTNVTCPS